MLSHRLGRIRDEEVYYEPDEAFEVSLSRSLTGRYIFLRSGSTLSTEYRLLDAIAQSQITNISDRMWTQNAGTRTTIGSLGKFWDDKAGADIDAGSFLN